MAIYKKVVVLTGSDNACGVAHLTLSGNNCELKLSCDMDGKALLFRSGEKLQAQNFEIGKDIYAFDCEDIGRVELAVIGEKNGVTVPLVFGSTYKSTGAWELVREYERTVEREQKSDIKRAVENLEVKEQFPAPKTSEKKELDFYYSVKQQLDEMFVCYPEQKELAEVVPNSKWVSVDGTEGSYTVGVIYCDDAPKYICYGVPAGRDTMPPDSMRSICQYLMADGADSGYWVVFQNADSGETVKNED